MDYNRYFYPPARQLVNKKISRERFVIEWAMAQREQGKELPSRRGFLCYRTRRRVKGYSRSVGDAVCKTAAGEK